MTTVHCDLHLPRALMQEAEIAADAEGRSLNSFIVRTLAARLAELKEEGVLGRRDEVAGRHGLLARTHLHVICEPTPGSTPT